MVVFGTTASCMETCMPRNYQRRPRRQAIGIRIEDDLLAQVDAWASRYRMTRSQALRSLVSLGILGGNVQ